jgi:signal recognition particle receptor subunit beta
MVVFNPQKKEIDIKVVYYGPALCGKTTNLKSVHLNLNPHQRGELISLATKDDRTLFFDFLPIQLENIKGFKTRFHIYTVPGQVFYTLTRKAVLTGVDGVIFVADSQNGKMKENIESLNDLKDNLKYYNKTLDSIPLVIQYNKRDLPGLIPLTEMNEQLNTMRAPYFEACALSGKGVMQTLTMCCKLVLKQMQNKSKSEQTVSRAPAGKAAEQPTGDLPQLSLSEHDAVTADGMVDQPRGTPEAQRSAADQTPDGTDAGITATAPHEHDPSNGDGAAAAAAGLDLHFKNERTGGEDTVRLLSGTDTHGVPCDANNQNGKKICPRCSLKFKPNVKQCPICRISLVPEEAGDLTVTRDRAAELLPPPVLAMKAMDSEPEPAGKAPEAEPNGHQVEIISCEQALRASPTAITIPLRMRIKKTNAEVMVELTVSITTTQLHSC